MAEIVWTEAAANWLEEIHSFIARDNPPAADRTVRGIYDRIQTLASFPEIGYVHDRAADPSIRVLLYGHYRIAYLLKNRERVEILGIFHGSLDIARFLE